jgi:hypothetical protein
MSLPDPFPEVKVSEDYNPAIRLFGKRFIKEQTVLEYLSEFLAVVFSEKRISGGEVFDSPLPSLTDIRKWSSLTTELCYRSPIKLNLKLFAFLSCSLSSCSSTCLVSNFSILSIVFFLSEGLKNLL